MAIEITWRSWSGHELELEDREQRRFYIILKCIFLFLIIKDKIIDMPFSRHKSTIGWDLIQFYYLNEYNKNVISQMHIQLQSLEILLESREIITHFLPPPQTVCWTSFCSVRVWKKNHKKITVSNTPGTRVGPGSRNFFSIYIFF